MTREVEWFRYKGRDYAFKVDFDTEPQPDDRWVPAPYPPAKMVNPVVYDTEVFNPDTNSWDKVTDIELEIEAHYETNQI